MICLVTMITSAFLPVIKDSSIDFLGVSAGPANVALRIAHCRSGLIEVFSLIFSACALDFLKIVNECVELGRESMQLSFCVQSWVLLRLFDFHDCMGDIGVRSTI